MKKIKAYFRPKFADPVVEALEKVGAEIPLAGPLVPAPTADQ